MVKITGIRICLYTMIRRSLSATLMVLIAWKGSYYKHEDDIELNLRLFKITFRVSRQSLVKDKSKSVRSVLKISKQRIWSFNSSAVTYMFSIPIACSKCLRKIIEIVHYAGLNSCQIYREVI